MRKRAVDLHAIGEKLEFNDAREKTRGQRSEGILTLEPERNGPGAHIHTQQVEGFEVLSGTLVLVANGRPVTLRTGESFLVAAGEAHTFRNGGTTTPVVATFWYEPALNIACAGAVGAVRRLAPRLSSHVGRAGYWEPCDNDE